MSKPNVPFQIGMRFAARKKQNKPKLIRSHSPLAARTTNNFCDEIRRHCKPPTFTNTRSRSVQPKRVPRSEQITYYRLANWMEDLMPIIYNKPITEIKMPGTHDSATYAITSESQAVSSQKYAKITAITGDPRQWTTTQYKSIKQQLEMGCRFFDLRVSFEDGVFYLHHGLIAKKLPYELNIIKTFLEQHPYEFIILKIKPASTCQEFLDPLQQVIHILLENKHILMKAQFMKNGYYINQFPADIKMHQCIGKVMVIIDDRSFVEGKEDCGNIRISRFLFGNTALYSVWPNQRDYNKLLQCNIDSQPPINNKQLYCLHFTFTANVKYMASHMSKKKEIHDIYTMTKSLEEDKEEKTGSKSNWAYMIDLLQTRTNKRNININVVDFLDGMKSHRVILLNFLRYKNPLPSLPPPLKPHVKKVELRTKDPEPDKKSKSKKKKSKS